MKKKLIFFLSVMMVCLLCWGCGSSSSTTMDLVGEPSDYSSEDNWLTVPEDEEYDVDVIYFYPTTAPVTEGTEIEVCDIDNEKMRDGAKSVYEQQATAFEETGNMYAPYYRQVDASKLAGMTQEEMLEAERNETRTDVFASLDYYFENYNNGKPYILAGHSQGAMMICLILDEYMEVHPEYYENMVVAYMIGNAATKGWLEENPHVKMATGAGDTGVLATWNTEGPENIDEYNMVVPEGAVCINPLNWKTDETYAGVDENKGSLVDGEIVKGIADAQINLKRGSVICNSVEPRQYANGPETEVLFGPQSYHRWDYGFYYENIRENSKLRAANFLK
ncbi:MAG: DUF3089 domain-containing protein [Clostridiales bacterium]|nr:DUF3089 domain-containing protein [Clostridiales bacterium]